MLCWYSCHTWNNVLGVQERCSTVWDCILAIIAVLFYFGAALGQFGNAHDRSERLRKIEQEKEERKARIEANRDVEAAAATVAH